MKCKFYLLTFFLNFLQKPGLKGLPKRRKKWEKRKVMLLATYI